MTAPATPVSIPCTQTWPMRASGSGHDYVIDVALPIDYEQTSGGYPVVFVLDGNVSFPLVTATMRMLTMHEEAEEVIVVGVGYPGVRGMKDAMGVRTRDLTPTETSWWQDVYVKAAHGPLPEYVGSGGAASFLSFLLEDLVPVVTERFRVDMARSAVLGHSFGGLFGLTTLLTRPEAFPRYILGSPSVWWDGKVLHRIEESYASAHQDLDAEVFLCVGGGEPWFMAADMYDMAHRLSSHAYPSLRLSVDMIDGQSHKASVPGFVVKGIRHFYGREHRH